MIKLAPLAQALVVAAGLAIVPVVAFAQKAPTAPTAPTAPKVAKPAVAKSAKTPVRTAEAACAVHRKDSKEFKECVGKTKAGTQKTLTKDPTKKS